MKLPKGVELTELTFIQDGDTCSSDEIQYLNVKIEDSGAGKYFVISTERWAFDSIDELVKVIKKAISKESTTCL
jgi:hypothetical protein